MGGGSEIKSQFSIEFARPQIQTLEDDFGRKTARRCQSKCRLRCEEVKPYVVNPEVTCRQPPALEYIHVDISSNHTVSALEGRN